MAYQTLECDRRGGLAARERREELSDPVPVLCDPIEVDRSFLPVDHGEWYDEALRPSMHLLCHLQDVTESRR